MIKGSPVPAIISAYAVHPLPGAEAVVNAALLDVLRAHLRIGLITSESGYQSLKGLETDQNHNLRLYADGRNYESYTLLERMADWIAYSKWQPQGAIARLVDRIRVQLAGLPPLRMAAWSKRAAGQILDWLQNDFQDAVVWARATPPHSFQAAIFAWRYRSFPLVVNYNDPMPHCLLWGETQGRLTPAYDRLQHRQNQFLLEHAQAWTFPSRRLADLMIAAAGLDSNRCFIIPHLVPDGGTVRFDDRTPADGPWIIYAGTFYLSMFSEEIKSGIARYAQSCRRLRFQFVLKKPGPQVIRWINENVPHAEVHIDLNPSEVRSLINKAQAILVVDSSKHSSLLLTKIVEAIHTDKPILALSPLRSTTGEVVSAAGGVVVDPTTAERVEKAFHQLESFIEDESQQRVSIAARRKILSRFSAERIAADSLAVLEYARKRFDWLQHQNEVEPEPPAIERWP